MTRRLLGLLALLCLLAPLARAEQPPTLPACQTVEEVRELLLLPGEEAQPAAVERGKIRYIFQDSISDPDFFPDYWYGGEPGSELDLTVEISKLKGHFNEPYTYYARNMCTRAVYSMALSYLGVDLTPGAMSALLGMRDISMPYDEVTDQLPQIERVDFPQPVFDSMFEAYQNDGSYSPVYLYFRRANGTTHCLLVVARREDGRYIVVDPRYHTINGESVRVYTIALNTTRQFIVTSDFRSEHVESTIIRCCQWRLIEEE